MVGFGNVMYTLVLGSEALLPGSRGAASKTIAALFKATSLLSLCQKFHVAEATI